MLNSRGTGVSFNGQFYWLVTIGNFRVLSEFQIKFDGLLPSATNSRKIRKIDSDVRQKYAMYAEGRLILVIRRPENMQIPTRIGPNFGSKISKFPTYIQGSFPGPTQIGLRVPYTVTGIQE